MAEGQDPKVIGREYIEKMDKLVLSPEGRAHEVLSAIMRDRGIDDPIQFFSGPLFWDMMCFCVMWLQANVLQVDDPDFRTLAIDLRRWLFTAHYNGAEEFLPEGDRDDRMTFWSE